MKSIKESIFQGPSKEDIKKNLEGRDVDALLYKHRDAGNTIKRALLELGAVPHRVFMVPELEGMLRHQGFVDGRYSYYRDIFSEYLERFDSEVYEGGKFFIFVFRNEHNFPHFCLKFVIEGNKSVDLTWYELPKSLKDLEKAIIRLKKYGEKYNNKIDKKPIKAFQEWINKVREDINDYMPSGGVFGISRSGI